MEKLIVCGGQRLNGVVELQTSKNAVLPILSASLMVKGKIVLSRVPEITDAQNMLQILGSLGSKVSVCGNDTIIDNSECSLNSIDSALIKSMRSSIFLLGSMLSRFKRATLIEPGGCKIGARPIDLHIKALKKLGVRIASVGEQLFFDASNSKPSIVHLKIPSVGVTENLVQFASTLKGKTTIYNAAREPEVVDLCKFLNSCGANIVGAGTKKITINGVDSLHEARYKPMSDRIVEGTILLAVAGCGGDVIIKNACGEVNSSLIKKLSSMGCQIEVKNDIIHIISSSKLKNLKETHTGFYPDFATDLQSLFVPVCVVSKGKTKIHERVFENRFLVVEELKKMGAEIVKLNSKSILIKGDNTLCGSSVYAKDLRGGAALVVAALIAKGKSEIYDIHFIDRGYSSIEKLFGSLGAKIERVT